MIISVYPPLNTPPVSNAGPDQSITLPVNSVALNGTGSTDPDGTIIGFTWTKVAGPVAGTICNPATSSTTVTGLTAGVYTFELSIVDDSSAIDRDTVIVTVFPAPNILPTALAGRDLSMTLPANRCLLDGSASLDTDGWLTPYCLIKIEGPISGIIINTLQAATAVT